ncbi:RXRA [Mytilus coruscus]|uniref:RXRA n=1 Tax=Mytilus coruscus TaxID=42192 RepID=A0A6J8F297_MYTCO|nr:RXRA [Mytilus coruscus]
MYLSEQHPVSSMSDRVLDSDSEVVVNVKSEVCCNCEEKFDSRKQLKKHEKLCGQEIEASVGCPDCQKSFSRSDNMKRHWRLKHGGDEKEKPSPSSKICKISSMHGRSLSADSGCAKSKTKVSRPRKEPLTKKSEIGTEPGVSSSISSLKKEEKVGVINIIRKKQSESMTQKSDKKNPVRARSLSPTKCSSQKSKIQLDKGLKITNKTLPVDNIHLKLEFEPGKTQSYENCISTSTKKVHSRSRTLSSGRPQQLSDKCDGSESKIFSVENTLHLGDKSYQCRSKTPTEDCGLKLSDKHARSRSKTPSGDKSNRSRCKTLSGDSALQSSDRSNRSKSAKTHSAPKNFPSNDSANLKVITPTENSASTRNKMTSQARSLASGSAISNSKISIHVDEAGDRKISPGKKETSKQNILSPIKAVITKKTAKHHDGMTSPGKKETEKQTPKQNVDITSPKRKTIKPILKVEVSTPSGHVSKMTFNCKLCPKSFTTRMGYRQHCKRSHKIDVDLNDSMNEKLEITQSPDIKQEYITSKSGKKRKKPIPGICKVCGDISTGKHYGVESCRSCNDFFYKKYVKKKNLDNGLLCYIEKTCVIDRNNRHSCDYCRLQKCLAVGMSKQGHLRTTAGIKNRLKTTKSRINFFQCHLCGVRFLSKDGLNKHNEKKHFGQNRDYKCDLCGKQYLLKTSLWQHCLTVHKGKNLSDKGTKVEAIEQNEQLEQLELPENINWILAQNPNQCIDIQENLIDTKVDLKEILPTELPQKVLKKSMHKFKMNKSNDKEHESMETEKEVMCNKLTGLISMSTTEVSTHGRVRTKKLKSVQKVVSVKTNTKKGILKSKKLKKNKFKKLQNHKQLSVMSKYELRNKLLSEVKLKGKIKSTKEPSEGIPKTLTDSLKGKPKTLSESLKGKPKTLSDSLKGKPKTFSDSLKGKPKTLSESKLEPSERKPYNNLKENIMLKDVKILVKKFVPLPPVIDKSERQNETVSIKFDQNGKKGELTGKIDKSSDNVSNLIDSNKDTIDKEEGETTLEKMSLLLSGTHKDSLHERLVIPYIQKSPQGRIDNKYKGLKITLPSSGEGRIITNEENLEGTELEKSHKVLKNQIDFVNFKITLQTRSECRTVMSANKFSVGNRSEAKSLDGNDKNKKNNIIQGKSLLESETENETKNHNCPTDKNAKRDWKYSWY